MDIRNKSQVKLPDSSKEPKEAASAVEIKNRTETVATSEDVSVIATNENSMLAGAVNPPTVDTEAALETMLAQVEALTKANEELRQANENILSQLDKRVMETTTVGYDQGKAIAQIEEAAANAVSIQEAKYTWMAVHPSLVVHITVDGAKDKDITGQFRKISVPVIFKNGIYTTNDEKVAEALNEQCNREGIPKLFTASDNLMAAATISEGNKARERLRNAVSGGIDTTAGDNTQQNVTADAHLAKLMDDARRNAVITPADM